MSVGRRVIGPTRFSSGGLENWLRRAAPRAQSRCARARKRSGRALPKRRCRPSLTQRCAGAAEWQACRDCAPRAQGRAGPMRNNISNIAAVCVRFANDEPKRVDTDFPSQRHRSLRASVRGSLLTGAAGTLGQMRAGAVPCCALPQSLGIFCPNELTTRLNTANTTDVSAGCHLISLAACLCKIYSLCSPHARCNFPSANIAWSA